jgi:hypothetical protein
MGVGAGLLAASGNGAEGRPTSGSLATHLGYLRGDRWLRCRPRWAAREPVLTIIEHRATCDVRLPGRRRGDTLKGWPMTC